MAQSHMAGGSGPNMEFPSTLGGSRRDESSGNRLVVAGFRERGFLLF